MMCELFVCWLPIASQLAPIIPDLYWFEMFGFTLNYLVVWVVPVNMIGDTRDNNIRGSGGNDDDGCMIIYLRSR